MGDLNEYFSREEFQCPCGCGFDTVDTALLKVLTRIREHFDRAVYINSGSRCRNHNMAVGGSEHSQHLVGKAADIEVEGTPPHIVQELAHNLGVGGLGRYNTFTHIDVRNGIARWSVR